MRQILSGKKLQRNNASHSSTLIKELWQQLGKQKLLECSERCNLADLLLGLDGVLFILCTWSILGIVLLLSLNGYFPITQIEEVQD